MEHRAQAFVTLGLSATGTNLLLAEMMSLCLALLGPVQQLQKERGSGGGAKVIHSTFLPISTEQPGKHSGAARSLPEQS